MAGADEKGNGETKGEGEMHLEAGYRSPSGEQRIFGSEQRILGRGCIVIGVGELSTKRQTVGFQPGKSENRSQAKRHP